MSVTEELVNNFVSKIQEALSQGKRVYVRGVLVKKIEIQRTRKSMLIVINDGELTLYPSQLPFTRLVIL